MALLLRQGGHSARIEARLLTSLATIGQLAGWMAFDAGKHGLSQRYFFTALRCARESGFRAMGAHIVADLAFQAATREHPRDAISLGEAAATMAVGSPAGVQASVQTRLAYGYAVGGQLNDFERAYHKAIGALSDGRADDEPRLAVLPHAEPS